VGLTLKPVAQLLQAVLLQVRQLESIPVHLTHEF
jgi:hypothetical protein